MYKFEDTSLSLDERVRDLISLLTPEEKAGLLSSHQYAVPRLGIKEWYVGAEVARGYVSRNPDEPTTVFPQPIGMAGMFDPELMYKIGRIAGEEARIIHNRHPEGHLMLWGPTVDMCRNPLWGRNEEAYGEDPYLTGEMSKAYTLGLANRCGEYMQTIPTLKHFCANNTEPERTHANSNLEPRTKHEYYYAAFKPAITEGGAYSVMTAYNELSGVPGMINPDIQNILKDEWGLGFTVTDGGDFSQNVTDHRYSTSHAETIELALKNGMDIMTDEAELVRAAALQALSEGRITEKDIDRAVYCSMLARFRLGEFDKNHPYSEVDESRIDCEEFRKVNHRAALEQTVLLKNNGLLPLKKDMKIAVIGINGDVNLMDWYTGYSSYSHTIFDGIKAKFSSAVYDNGCDVVAVKSKLSGKYLGADSDGNVTALYDISDSAAHFEKSEYGHNEITLRALYNGKYLTENGYRADSDTTYRWFSQEIFKPKNCGEYTAYNTYFGKLLEVDESGKIGGGKPFGITDGKLFSEEIVSDGIKRAEQLAKSADAVIVCVGNDPMIVAREMYDRKTLSLPERQKELVRTVYGANKNTVMAVVSSYPYAICEEDEYLPAIIYTTHAGPELGTAFAEVLTGEYNPAGRLAQTWYKSEDELAPIDSYDIIENDMTYLYYKGEPLYPFGYGKSYSDFSYSDFSVSERGDKIISAVDVKNTSDTDGEEVVQIYFHPEAPRVKRAVKQLCAFSRRYIRAGESVRFEFEIEKRKLEFYDVTREKFCVESGDYRFIAGASCEDIRCEQVLSVSGESIPPRDLSKVTKAINYDRKYGTKMKYSKAGEFHYMQGGTLLFDDADLRAAKGIELTSGCAVANGKITVKADGETLAEVNVPPSVDIEKFITLTSDFKSIDKITTLEISMSQYTVIKEFRVIK